MPRQRLQWVCPFGGEHHPRGRQHVVNSRLAFRRHLTLIHSSDLMRRTTADGQPWDEIVPLVGAHLERRVAAYRRSRRHRGPTGPPGVSVSDTGGPSVVSAVSSVAPVGSAASAVTPSFQIVPAVSVLQPAGYRSPIDSSDKDDQTIGTVDTASDLFADRACAKAGYQGPRPGCQGRPGWLT